MSVQREREIFEACLALAPEAREAYLAEKCEEPDLADRVRRLVAAHERADGISTVLASGRPILEDPTEIGPYRIIERIGEGGMGVVYLAEQTRPIKRLVAIKIIKLGMDTKDVIARFDSERQALALMNHRNIARILDAGATENGRPYFVMEHVRGQSIVEFCDDRRLGIEDRLKLFVDVCRAIEHAHEKGVIHRDLKRSNILVTEEDGDPCPKVIDFGIAKATNQRLTELTLMTRFGHVVGTPEYMSPEQAAGITGEVDTRTDVYSLGVVLYELLVGARPFDFTDSISGHQEVLRVIREETPPAPSRRHAGLGAASTGHAVARSSTTADLTKRLRGDLDSITLKALAKDKARRYQTAAEFGSDIQRFLEGESVAAVPPDRWNTVTRVFQRYWKAAAVLAFLAIATPIAIGLTNRSVQLPASRGPARVLVMPFQFLGPPEEAYLAEGISEEISDRLSGLGTLAVLGRQTALYVANGAMSPDQIALELDVDFILDGTVRVQPASVGPAQMRIRAGLTSTSSLSQLWSETYDGSVDDVFGVQVDVAERVAEAVGVELPTTAMSGRTGTSRDLEAYDFYLRGNEYSRRSELESSLRASLDLYQQATDLDPSFAEAWAAMSIMRSRLRWRGYDPSSDNLSEARRAGERALQLDPQGGDGHLALGYYYYYGFRDYESAIQHLLVAVERKPNDAETLFALGIVARRLGQWDRSISALQGALDANPRHAEVAITLGETSIALGNYEEAEGYIDRAIAIAPDRPSGYLFKAWLYLASRQDVSAAATVLKEGWDIIGPRLFALYGIYVSDLDWWITRALAHDPQYQQMFASLDLHEDVDSVAYYIHKSEFYKTLGDHNLAATYGDSARSVLENRGNLTRQANPGGMTVTDRSALAGRWAKYSLASLNAGSANEALRAAAESERLYATELDALHGTEPLIQIGLVEATLGLHDAAVDRLANVFSKPSSFRIEMLRHDSTLSWLLTEPQLRNLQRTPR